MKSKLVKYVVMILAIVFAVAGYCAFGYINDRFFAGIYDWGKYLSVTLGLVPVIVYDVAKNKRLGSVVFAAFIVTAVCGMFYLTFPEVTYAEAADELYNSYDRVTGSQTKISYDEAVSDIPAYYSGAYTFDAQKNGEQFYVVVNPKTGFTQVIKTENGKIV